MTRQTGSFLITLALYLSVGMLIAYQFDYDSFSDRKHPDKSATRVCFSVISKEAPAPQEPKKVEKKIEKKVEKKKVVKKREVVKKIEKKVEKRVVQKEPLPEPPKEEVAKEEMTGIVEEVVETETVAEVDETMTETVENVQPRSEETAVANIRETVDREQLQARQDMFLSTLTQRINSNKSYPKSARRRGIEGAVDIRFEVCSDGKVENITVVSGKRIFKKSAINAILKSFPIEVDSALFDFPHQFNLTLVYVLK